MAMISEMLSTMPAVKVGKLRTMGISGGLMRPYKAVKGGVVRGNLSGLPVNGPECAVEAL